MDLPDIPTTFTLFATLPLELRIKIWKHCLPSARVVPVRYSRNSRQYITDTPPHFLLQTNHESRTLFLEHYIKLTFSPNYGSAIYIDFDIDTPFFDTIDCSPAGDLALDLASSPKRDLIQRLAISVDLWEILRVFRWDALSEIKCLGGLKTLSLVLLREKGGAHVEDWVDVGDGRETRIVREGEGSVEAEIRHSLWYVECLRGELERTVRDDNAWCGGSGPNVQLWLW